MPTVAEFATAIKGNQGQLNPSSAQPIGVTAQRSAESPGGDDRSHLARFLAKFGQLRQPWRGWVSCRGARRCVGQNRRSSSWRSVSKSTAMPAPRLPDTTIGDGGTPDILSATCFSYSCADCRSRWLGAWFAMCIFVLPSGRRRICHLSCGDNAGARRWRHRGREERI